MKLGDNLIRFFKKQDCIIIATIDKEGTLHASCKGLIDIEEAGIVRLLDLYKGRTYGNLKRNNNISLIAVNERNFEGYCLKGKAEITPKKDLTPKIIEKWDKRLTSRITKRLIENVRSQKKQKFHAEAQLPKPEYLLSVKIEKIVNLRPGNIE
jgi:predicted pyridoxine 5'-phosphate oxidase superfamily flavin-nucleotide-binding protein